MITVEDLINTMASSLQISIQMYDYRLIESFNRQLQQGHGLTEKQGSVAIKIIKKYHKILTAATDQDILKFLSSPVFKHPFRQLVNIKKISVTNKKHDSIVGKVIKVEFLYNEKYIELIKSKRSNLGIALWSKEDKCWLFSLCEDNIKFLNYLVVTEGFEVDEEYLRYSNQLTDVVLRLDDYVPMVTMDKNFPSYKNTSEHMPLMYSTDIVPALFEARRRGVGTWSEEIENYIKNYHNSVTVDFLRSNAQEIFYVDSKIFDISSLEDIVLNLNPIVFVIPGGSEFEKIKLVYNFLKKIGIQEKYISVMFRLSSDSGKKFNDFVKQSNLNNPITENTKIVFVSGKIPKPLIKSKKFFNAVINLGFENAHYTAKMFLEKHHNVIQYSEKPIQNNFLWQLLES